MAPDPYPKSPVDIAGAIEAARRMTADAAPGDPIAELGAVYAELGTLLEDWNSGTCNLSAEEYEQQCQDYVARLIVLGKVNEEYEAQKWALWISKNRASDERGCA